MNTLFESLTAAPPISPPSELGPIDSTVLDSAQADVVVQTALDLADAPRAEYNPLLFFGPSGTGKTSLLREFAQRWAAREPADQVHFCTGSDFARSYANALKTDGLPEFRQRRLSCALWLIDDLSELAGKQEAQRELLRLIERQSDRWLVLAADSALTDLPLLPQLTGRLSSGLALRLVHPDRALRQLLVCELCSAHEIELVPSAASELVSRCRTRRQLEHQVHQLAAAGPHAEAIGFEQVLDTLDATIPCPDVHSIVSAVAGQLKISVGAMRGSSRRRHVVHARGIAMLLIRHSTRLSLQKIGCYFGKRDHSTVLHAIQQAALLIAKEPLLQRQLVDLGFLDVDNPAVDNPLADVNSLALNLHITNSRQLRSKKQHTRHSTVTSN